ncbi:hypothetical protein H2198_002533 [Neophaeococcomyces mojaviensis]|uniref:Uncharacterized protein n=1 Tax=Neophaeococcomyces mojaviensis TaxID=3383035 RepID=A0ACC3AED1_9EURO|nr:hypothetical protein H2198_002533 [Knufia sp. JES_112]
MQISMWVLLAVTTVSAIPLEPAGIAPQVFGRDNPEPTPAPVPEPAPVVDEEKRSIYNWIKREPEPTPVVDEKRSIYNWIKREPTPVEADTPKRSIYNWIKREPETEAVEE